MSLSKSFAQPDFLLLILLFCYNLQKYRNADFVNYGKSKYLNLRLFTMVFWTASGVGTDLNGSLEQPFIFMVLG